MSVSIDLIALSLLPLQWGALIAEKLRIREPPDGILAEFERLHPARVAASTLRSRAKAALDRASLCDVQAVVWGAPEYPWLLSTIFDFPPVLWVRGCLDALSQEAVAVVGSRAGSPYALEVATNLARDVAQHRVAVVSGLARGVDSAAHRGALSAGGVTLAVLGSGPDVVYPREHHELACQIAQTGAIVSELPPATPPQAWFFPRRNRIISGLSRAVVVVEAGEKSGSLITARCALEQGREVLAVPGNVLDGRNRGGHALIRDGAKIVETADDILNELGWAVPERSIPGQVASNDPVLACLSPGEACGTDTLAERAGLGVAQVLARLLELELGGRVRRLDGGRFVRVDSSC